jgi:hypothetical protein
MKKLEYYLFKINSDKKVCCIEDIERNIPDAFYLQKGISLKDIYPTEVTLNIFPESGDILTDFINNISRCLLISLELKEILVNEGLDIKKVEYLPFQLKDKKQRLLTKEFYIANVLIKINCLDKKQSQCSIFKKTGNILNLETAVLNEDNIPQDEKLFRIGEYPSRIVIRSDLFDLLQQKGFTGLTIIKQGESFI